MILPSHPSAGEILLAVAVSLTFLGLGFYGLRTGTALAKGYRFNRDKHYIRFWLVTTMWLGMGSLMLLFLVIEWFFEPRGP